MPHQSLKKYDTCSQKKFLFSDNSNYKRRKIRGFKCLMCLIEKQYDFFVKFQVLVAQYWYKNLFYIY